MTYGMLSDLQILRDIANQEGYGFTRTPDVTVSSTVGNLWSGNAGAQITQITLSLDYNKDDSRNSKLREDPRNKD